MANKRAKAVTELHSKPRKMNPDAPRRIGVVLSVAQVSKLKIKAYETGATLQLYVSNIISKHLGE